MTFHLDYDRFSELADTVGYWRTPQLRRVAAPAAAFGERAAQKLAVATVSSGVAAHAAAA